MKKLTLYKRTIDPLLDLDRSNKRTIQILLDIVLIVICYILAMALRLDGFEFLSTPNVWNVLIVVLPVTLYVFIRTGLYRAVLRYVSSRMLRTIISGIFLSAVAMFATDQIFVLPVPRSVPIIYAMLLFCAIGGTRFGWRTLYRFRTTQQKENVIIYGAGQTGRQLLEAIRYSGEYAVVAFIDDNKTMHNQEISSVKVYGPEKLEMLKNNRDVEAILLAAPGATKLQRKQIIERVEKHTLQLRTIPSIADLASGKAKVSDLRVVQADELLGRDIVPPNDELMKANIFGKIVMVTGAGGSIGTELCRQIIQQKPAKLILFDVSEYGLYKIDMELRAYKLALDIQIIPLIGSVQNKDRLVSILSTYAVQTIYHAAAYKHVPLVEQNIAEGIGNNIFGTQRLVEAAVFCDVESLTLISTDKAVRPTNFMGASKRVAELICQSYAQRQTKTKISMVRFGNVLGSSGSVIPRFKEQIKSGGPVTVTHPKITRFFMTISEASQLVIQASAMAKGGDVFLLDMGEPVEITDLAQRMIRLYGFVPYFEDSSPNEVENGDILIKFTGLRPGEKLYEELLVGHNPIGTEHPRIMSADEVSLDAKTLDFMLKRLSQAIDGSDVAQIKNLFLELPIDFKPEGALSDMVWLEKGQKSGDGAQGTTAKLIELNRGS